MNAKSSTQSAEHEDETPKPTLGSLLRGTPPPPTIDDDEPTDDGFPVTPLARPAALVEDEDEDTGDPEDDEDETEAAAETESAEAEPEEDDEVDNVVAPKRRVTTTKKTTKPKARETFVATVPKKGTPARDEAPRDEILQLAAQGYSEVKFNLRRKLPAGWAQVKNGIRVPTKALLSDMRDAITRYAGGGTFEFTVVDIETGTTILPRWLETYEGTPLPPNRDYAIVWDEAAGTLSLMQNAMAVGAMPPSPITSALRGPMPSPLMSQPAQPLQPPTQQELQHLAMQQLMQQVGPISLQNSPPAEMLPNWMQRQPPQQQWEFLLAARVRALEDQVRQGTFQGGAGGQNLANEWVHHEIRRQGVLQQENARLSTTIESITQQVQAQITAASKEAQARIEAISERAARAEKELERERAKNDLALLEAKIESLKLAQAQPKPAMDVVGLASALGPLAVAWMKAQSDSARAERDAQTQMLLAMTKKEDSITPMLTAAAPILGPVLVKLLENNGPQAQAEVLNIEHEQKMMQLKMFADFLAAMQPAEEPWHKQLIEVGLATIGGMMQNRKQLPPPQQQRTLPPQPQNGAQSQPQPQPQQAVSPQQRVLQRMAEQDPAAAQMVEAIYQQLPQELGFHTHEWMSIIFNVHVRQMPEELAPVILNHIVNCQNFGMLPVPLANVMESPREAFQAVFNPLPITQQDPQYIEQLIEQLVSGLEEMQEEEDGEEEDDVDNGVIITPAPMQATGS